MLLRMSLLFMRLFTASAYVRGGFISSERLNFRPDYPTISVVQPWALMVQMIIKEIGASSGA